MAMATKIVCRRLAIKTYHPTKGDALVTLEVVALESRPLTDPFFGETAKKLAKSRRWGKVVEWRAYAK